MKRLVLLVLLFSGIVACQSTTSGATALTDQDARTSSHILVTYCYQRAG